MDNYFKPQSEDIDMNLVGDLENLEKLSRQFGEQDLTVSSGRRNPDKTLGILNERKTREGLDKYSPEVQSVVDEVLLRGKTPNELTYPSGKWYPQAEQNLKKLAPNEYKNILEKLANTRKDFGGYESPHLQGKKLDVPVSSFIQKYGETEGPKRAKQYFEYLKKQGYDVIFEPEAGQNGVIDIRLKDKPKMKPTSNNLSALDNIGDNEMSQDSDTLKLIEEVQKITNSPVISSANPQMNINIPTPSMGNIPTPETVALPEMQKIAESIEQPKPESALEKYIKLQERLQKRLQDSQTRQRQELGSLAFLRGAQRNNKGAQDALEKIAELTGQNTKDLNQQELDSFNQQLKLQQMDRALQGDQAGANLYRKFLESRMPELSIPENVPAEHLARLISAQKASTSKTGQQSDYMTKNGDPVFWEPNSAKYINAITGQEIKDSGSVIRNYMKTGIDPKTGNVVEFRPGEGMLNIPTPSVPQVESAPPAQQMIQPKTEQSSSRDFTYEDLNPKQRDTFNKIEEEYMKDVAESREFGDTLANVSDLVNSDISAAIPAIKRQLARSVGKEVGVMTDADVAAFSGDQSLIGALERFAKLKSSGTMTDRDKEQYRQIIQLTNNNLDKVLQNKGMYHANRIQKRIPEASTESLMNLLSVDASRPTSLQDSSNKARMQMPDGQTVKINKDKIDAFLKKYPNAKELK